MWHSFGFINKLSSDHRGKHSLTAKPKVVTFIGTIDYFVLCVIFNIKKVWFNLK